MSAAKVQAVTVFLGGDPEAIRVRYGADGLGSYAVLDLDAVQVHVSQASPEFLQRLSDVFAELARFRSGQSVKAVAA